VPALLILAVQIPPWRDSAPGCEFNDKSTLVPVTPVIITEMEYLLTTVWLPHVKL